MGPNFVGMVLNHSPFRIISDDLDVHPKWLTSAIHSFNIGPIEKIFKNLIRDSLANFNQYLVEFQNIHVSDDPNLHPRWLSSVENSSCRHFSISLFKSGERYRLN